LGNVKEESTGSASDPELSILKRKWHSSKMMSEWSGPRIHFYFPLDLVFPAFAHRSREAVDNQAISPAVSGSGCPGHKQGAADEQAGADQEHESEGDLDHHQRAAHLVASALERPPASLKASFRRTEAERSAGANPSRKLDNRAAPAANSSAHPSNAHPDEELLGLTEKGLRARGYQVFIDRHLVVVMEWAREIEQRISRAEAVVVLLSAASVQSEMLAYEIQIAREAAQRRDGKPLILPVRVKFDDPLPESLAGSLDGIQWAQWNGPEENDVLLAETQRFPTPGQPTPLCSRSSWKRWAELFRLIPAFMSCAPRMRSFMTPFPAKTASCW
jgi:hypothetical protein